VSAVDAPPGVAFAGRAAGEFVARTRSQRLARRVFLYVTGAGLLTLAIGARRIHAPLIELVLIAPLVCMSVAGVGYAVRRARLLVDPDGVRWGWAIGGFRMHTDRMKEVRVYPDAVALTPKRGSTWYLSRRDWDDFDDLRRSLGKAGIPYQRSTGTAPLAARLQSYGIVLDLLLIADAVCATLALAVAWLL
jgi:hypothetical protein